MPDIVVGDENTQVVRNDSTLETSVCKWHCPFYVRKSVDLGIGSLSFTLDFAPDNYDHCEQVL